MYLLIGCNAKKSLFVAQRITVYPLSNMPAHIYCMYFIVTLFVVIYIPEVSTVFSGTQHRLNYGVYFQTIHPAVQLGNNYIIGSINISLPSPRAPIESYYIYIFFYFIRLLQVTPDLPEVQKLHIIIYYINNILQLNDNFKQNHQKLSLISKGLHICC